MPILFMAALFLWRVGASIQFSHRSDQPIDRIDLILGLVGFVAMAGTFIAEFPRRFRVTWSDAGIEVFRLKRRGEATREVIRAIRDDQVSFHLFTDKDEVVVSKKKVPSGLLLKLVERQHVKGSRT